jgi:hypothetical protein
LTEVLRVLPAEAGQELLLASRDRGDYGPSAKRLTAALAWLDPALAEPEHVQTNILRIDRTIAAFAAIDH